MSLMVFRRGVDDEAESSYQVVVIDRKIDSGEVFLSAPIPLQLQFPTKCIIPCVDAYAEAVRATVIALCDETSEYQQDFKFCISCTDVYGRGDAEALKREIINPRFALFIDTCAQRSAQRVGTSTFSAVPTPTNTAALESVWSSLDSVASLSGYTPAATDFIIGTTVTTVLPTTLPGGAVSSFATTYTTMIPNPKYFATSTPSSTSSPSSNPTSSSTEVGNTEKSLAWIAGPVVGGVVALLLIATAMGFFVVRRRRRALSVEPAVEEATPKVDGTFDKAQLHSDPIVYVPSELQGDRNFWAGVTPASMNEHPAELPAYGPVGNGEHGRG